MLHDVGPTSWLRLNRPLLSFNPGLVRFNDWSLEWNDDGQRWDLTITIQPETAEWRWGKGVDGDASLLSHILASLDANWWSHDESDQILTNQYPASTTDTHNHPHTNACKGPCGAIMNNNELVQKRSNSWSKNNSVNCEFRKDLEF